MSQNYRREMLALSLTEVHEMKAFTKALRKYLDPRARMSNKHIEEQITRRFKVC